MGAFFTNCQVRGVSSPAVIAALKKITTSAAFVSPADNGWITIYPRASEVQSDALGKIAAALSEDLQTEVISFLVHDSDIAAYELYRSGTLTDEFDSCPDYFDDSIDDATRKRLQGRPEILHALCGPDTSLTEVQAILQPVAGFPVMAEEVIGEIASLLGIDADRATLGFNYFQTEGADLLPDADKFTRIGPSDDEEADEDESGNPGDALFSTIIITLASAWHQAPGPEASTAIAWLIQSGLGPEEARRKFRQNLEEGATALWSQCKLPGKPAMEELKLARDQGPDALASLIAERTPTALTDVGVIVAECDYYEFMASLLKSGLDPRAPDHRGYSALAAAKTHGESSPIYQLLKAAADTMK